MPTPEEIAITAATTEEGDRTDAQEAVAGCAGMLNGCLLSIVALVIGLLMVAAKWGCHA